MSSMVSQMLLVVKKKKKAHLPMQETEETQVQSLGREDPLGKGLATHSSILAWRIPWAEEPGGLQSKGLQRVGHNWSDLACMYMSCIHDTLYMSSLSCLPSCIHLNRACALFLMTLYMLGFCLEYPCSSLSLLGNSYLSIRSHIRYSSRKTSLTPLP